jgi:ribosomal protein S6--L-glutamate ligase
MKIGILANAPKEEENRLLEEVQKAGHDGQILKLLKCSISVGNDTPKIYYEGKDISGQFDIIIPRINLPHTIYGLTILRHFQVMGVYTTDVALSLELGRDKIRSHQFLIAQNVPVPITGYGHSKDDFDTVIQTVGGPPLILKLVEGTEGTGVFLAKDEKEAHNILGSFRQFDARVIAQEFIEESSGQDIRCFVVGNRVVAAMRRESQDGDFRANVALGAHSFKADLSEEDEKLALNAARAIGINVAGIDVIPSKRGHLIIEINVSPDFGGEFGLEKTTGVNVAAEIVKFAIEGKKKFNKEAHSFFSIRRWLPSGEDYPSALLPQQWQ